MSIVDQPRTTKLRRSGTLQNRHRLHAAATELGISCNPVSISMTLLTELPPLLLAPNLRATFKTLGRGLKLCEQLAQINC